MPTSDGAESTQTMTFTEFDIKKSPKISQKLRDENDYPAWATEAKSHLRRRKLTNVVTRSQKDEPSGSAEDNEKWQNKTDRALDYLTEPVEEGARLKIRASKPAAEARRILEAHCKGQRRTHIKPLLKAVTVLKTVGRKTALGDHVGLFGERWLRLAQAVGSLGGRGARCLKTKSREAKTRHFRRNAEKSS